MTERLSTENFPVGLLEFDKLLEIISELSHCEASRKSVLEIRPLGSLEEISSRQGLIGEIMRLSQEGTPLKLSDFPDITRLISRVRPEGSVLEGRELADFVPVLEVISDVSWQVHEHEGLPLLKGLTYDLTGFPDILRILKKSVDGEGNILDSASALLAELREKTRRLEGRIRKKLEELVRDESIAVFLQDDFITKRSGRWVIPVRMDAKGQVAGVVHDVSKSGETAFVEPLVIINLANELENLYAEQKAEEIRILKSISARLRQSADAIDAEYLVLVQLDVLNCVAGFAVPIGMEMPEINDSGGIRLVQARHPLLLLALRKGAAARSVVPLDVHLGDDDTVMVITGSNAGGKTISIKTIGLLILMALSGMPVPARSSSSFPLTGNLLADIGDEQSIENNLSTFSAHISNLSRILKNAGPRSLVLLDELGTGTDPEEGAALACAILQELRKSGALVFATTHLADIKGFVHRTAGMVNASMEFDQETLTPLYRLRIGEPGQSYAIETARRYGLPDHVIDSAKAMLGGLKIEFDNLIAELNSKRAEQDRILEDLRIQKEEMENRNRQLEKRLEEAKERRDALMSQCYKEASEIVGDTKRQMGLLVEELKRTEKEKRREVVRQVESKQKEIGEKIREYEKEDAGAPPLGEIAEGDVVFVRSLGYDARVVHVMPNQNRLRVSAGGKEIEVPAGEIRLRKGKKIDTREKVSYPETPDEAVPFRINLLGLRVDDALSRLEPFLNHASMAGLPEVIIIHGVGTGILSKAVKEHLEGHPLVSHFRSGEKSEGGAGVTIATLA